MVGRKAETNQHPHVWAGDSHYEFGEIGFLFKFVYAQPG
jgi:hypothetical protein